MTGRRGASLSFSPDSLLALVVDRDSATRRRYAAALQLRAWHVEEASDGPEALAKAIALHPSAIVMDTQLPGIDGYELCRLLRADVSTESIPIVIVTDASEERARMAGADAVLAKPCLPDLLVAELRRAATLRTHRRPGAPLRIAHAHDCSAAAVDDGASGTGRRLQLKRALHRGETIAPPRLPPALVCPACDRPLVYQRSHVGGVSVRYVEQWDYYECAAGCGRFQYRQRTRKLRQVG